MVCARRWSTQAPPKPSQPRPGVDRPALAAAHERRVSNREFVEILTSPPGLPGPPLQVRWEHDVSTLARPGTGGRQPSITRGFEVQATREVRDRLGEPTDHTFRGALLHVWEIPGGEDGIIAAGLSGQDVKSLFLEELGREVDWDNESDMLMLNTLGSIGQFEGARIKARTHDPFKRRWVLTGRGWPAAKRIGFKRDAGSWLVVDPLQWPHIKFAHMELANSGKNGGTSIRNLRDDVDALLNRVSAVAGRGFLLLVEHMIVSRGLLTGVYPLRDRRCQRAVATGATPGWGFVAA